MSTTSFAAASRSWCRPYDRRALLRVTAVLATPVSYLDPIHLDSVLAAALVERIGCWAATTVDPAVAPDDLTLPLVRTPIGGCLVWEATSLMPLEATPRAEIIRYRKRPPEPELLEWSTAAKLRFGMGPYRAYDLPLVVRPVTALGGVVHGDARAVRRLLARVTHLGKKRSQGYGAVRQWHVEPAEDLDAFPWWTPTGPTRPIPHAGGRPMGYRPPYWYRPWWVPCIA